MFFFSCLQIIQSADPITSLPMSVENMPSHIAVQATMMPIGDFNNPHPWTLRYPPTMFPILPIEVRINEFHSTN